MKNNELQINEKFKLTIKRMGINGEGIGYYKRKIVFVPGAITGEEIVCEATNVAPNFINGKIIKISKESPHRVHDFDELSANVGGLELSHLDYKSQLKFKKDIIVQSLDRYQPYGYKNYVIKDTIPSPEPLHYRNKAQYQIREVNGEIICGLYKHGTQEVFNLTDMPTQKKLTSDIINRLVKIIKELNTPIYNEEKNSGIVKTIIVRESSKNKNAQLTFVTRTEKFPGKRDLITAINKDIPEVISISQNINPEDTSLVWGPTTKLLWGEKYLQESINGLNFNISPQSFLQLNIKQTENLYQVAAKYAQLSANDNLFDAYCGVGTIGISMAKHVKKIYGVEIIPEAIKDANLNAEENGVQDKCDYRVGDIADVYPALLKKNNLTALIVDPPRTGLDDHTLETIVNYPPKKFTYISCNPSTLAKDLRILSEKFNVTEIQPVDMFSQTPQVESVTKLIRK